MQKQIFIRHDSGEINDIVGKIINCMQLVVMPDDVVKCLFCLEKDSYSIVEEIKINTSYKTFFIISDILIMVREMFKDTEIIRKLIWIFYPIGQLMIIFSV